MERKNDMKGLTKREMEVLRTVFRSFETGLREATIYPKVISVYKIPKRSLQCSSTKPYFIINELLHIHCPCRTFILQ
jgi:hypothetical protein